MALTAHSLHLNASSKPWEQAGSRGTWPDLGGRRSEHGGSGIQVEPVEPGESREVSVETHQPLTLHESCGRQMGIGAEPVGPLTPPHQMLGDLPAVGRLRTE